MLISRTRSPRRRSAADAASTCWAMRGCTFWIISPRRTPTRRPRVAVRRARRPVSMPVITSRSRPASPTVLASGPAWSSDQPRGNVPSRGIRPNVGFSPTHPQREAGTRIDPPVSEPRAPAQSPATTAIAEPPLEPPGLRLGSCGLRATPHQGLALLTP